jgi:hypothetical protein
VASTKILVLFNDGNIEEKAWYSLEPDKAVVCYYYQRYLDNYNTWEYKYDIGVKNGVFVAPNGDVIKGVIEK